MYASNIPWQGQTGKDSGGYAMFDTPENGLRAMMIDLKNKIARGLNTLSLLIPVYSATDQAAYVSAVSSWTGLDPNQTLTAGNVPGLTVAMVNFENGEMIYTQAQLDYAAQAAGVA